MPNYYVNKHAQTTGEHEIHTTSCAHGAVIDSNKQSLGYHENCASAKQAAMAFFSQVDGCFFCCKECNTK